MVFKKINWKKFSGWFIPSYLKGSPRFRAWIEVMLTPIVALYEQLLAFRAFAQKQIAITNQTLVLEDELSKLLGTEVFFLRNHTYQKNRRYLYYLREASTIRTYRYFLSDNNRGIPQLRYPLSEQQSKVDFVIRIGLTSLTADQYRKITAFVEYYKLPDKTYAIELATD